MTAEHSYQFTSAAPPYGASYGETFIEQGGYRYDNPYKFNGKELDQETGLYYYGARYYDPKMSMWLSVDPLAGEYPSLSPFAYTYGNPVRFADPTGMAPEDIILKGKNNSSIIIKTDLIDISVNAGAIIGDVGGNYTLEGDEVLIAALDIVGIADPTGAADAISATLEAKRGNWKGAVLSGLGIIPYLGDLGKAGKIPKHVKTLRKAIEAASYSKYIKHLPEGVKFRSFTKSNFRENLMRLTGKRVNSSIEAHHVFPQKFKKEFEELGININDPRFGAWWEKTSHRKNAWKYNQRWIEFFKSNPSQKEVLEFGKKLSKEFNFETNY